MDIDATASAAKIKMIKDAPLLECSCGNKTFIEAFVIKKVNSFNVIGRTELIDFPVYVCSKCGEIPKEIRESEAYSKLFNDENKINVGN